MKKKNNIRIEGIVYQHNLSKRVTGETSKAPGTEFIAGTVDIAVGGNTTNIVQVHWSYVVAKTKDGKENKTYTELSKILDGTYPCYMQAGSQAKMLSINASFAANDFYTEKDGVDTLIEAKRIENGFIRSIDRYSAKKPTDTTNPMANFEVDMVITGYKLVEANEEKNLPEKGVIRGCVFNFRDELIPVEFSVLAPGAKNYFENLGASSSNPIFTSLKGDLVSEVIKRTIVNEGAFGDEIREVESNRKDYVVTYAKKEPYDFSEDTMTLNDLKKAKADRETHLAEIKSNYEMRKNTPKVVSTGAFDFGASSAKATDVFDF